MPPYQALFPGHPEGIKIKHSTPSKSLLPEHEADFPPHARAAYIGQPESDTEECEGAVVGRACQLKNYK